MPKILRKGISHVVYCSKLQACWELKILLTSSQYLTSPPSTIFFLNFYLFIYLWLCWVFVSVLGLSLVVASGGHSSSRCAGLSLSQPLSLRSTGSRRAGSVIVAHGAQLLHGMWDLPRPGLEPVSPALAGRFSTTAPPGKPHNFFFKAKTVLSGRD